MGVTSSIRPIFIPERAKALRADWAPGPGFFVRLPPVARSLMCKAVIPSSFVEVMRERNAMLNGVLLCNARRRPVLPTSQRKGTIHHGLP